MPFLFFFFPRGVYIPNMYLNHTPEFARMNSRSFKTDMVSPALSRRAFANRPWHTMYDLKCSSTSEETPLRLLKTTEETPPPFPRTLSAPNSTPTIALPSPKRFQRSSKPDAVAIIVSANQCHKVMSISADFSKRFGYQPNEICGRSLSILQGPNTDSKALQHAIKSACMSCPATLPLSLYTRDSAERAMTVSCWPITSADNDVTGCGLIIRDFDAAAYAWQKMATSDRRSYRARQTFRAQNNFRVGLTLHHEACICI